MVAKLKVTIAACGLLLGSAASAQVVGSNSLQQINGSYGQGTATTTTDANGTRTTVTGPGGSANRASGSTVTGQWYQANVGGGGTVGITSDYSRNGQASAFFSTTSGDSKADLQYYFGSITPLSQLSSISYDFFRDARSTTTATLAPVLRLDIAKNGAFAGSLVLENVYQTQAATPVNSWTTLNATLGSGIFWATNSALGPIQANANGGQKTLNEWIAANSGSTLGFYGASIGVGSGWNGTFSGAIDNVAINLAGSSTPVLSANFELGDSSGAVPEAGTWITMLAGFAVTGLAMRRRRDSVALAG